MAIEAVIFDWGGTLSQFVAAELVDAWRLAARHLAPDREDEVTAALVAVEAEFWATTATHQRSTTLGDLLAAGSARLGLDVAEALLEEAAVRHLDAWTDHVNHDPDAAPTLRRAARRAVCASACSPTPIGPAASTSAFSTRDGLTELIDARLYTSEMPYQKPHPSAFEAALRALDVERPDAAVFVGDRPWDDVVGAQRTGLRAVLRRNPHVPAYTVEPDAVIDELGELIEVVDAWIRP